MDYLKRKMKGWDFLEGAEWKIQRCASKHQRELIKRMYRRLKRSSKMRVKRDIANES